MGDLSKMFESLKDGPLGAGMGDMPGGFEGFGGVPPAKEMQETLESLRAVVQQGGLTDQEIEVGGMRGLG